MPMLVAAIFAEPEPVLRIHLAAARRRARRRHGEQLDLAGLGVDAADMLLAEVGEVDVVLGVRDHVVDVVRLALGRVLERLPGLDLAGGEVEPMDAGKAVVLRPDLAVDVRALRAHHVDLRGVDVLLGRQRRRTGISRSCDRTSPSWPGTCCRATDRRPCRCAARGSRSGSRACAAGRGYSVTLPVLGSSRPRICSPKLEYQAMPSASTITSCGSMVSRGRSYSVMTTRVAAAFRAGQRLERVVPLRSRAQIDAAEKVGHAAIDLDALVAALFHPPLAAAKLRVRPGCSGSRSPACAAA